MHIRIRIWSLSNKKHRYIRMFSYIYTIIWKETLSYTQDVRIILALYAHIDEELE